MTKYIKVPSLQQGSRLKFKCYDCFCAAVSYIAWYAQAFKQTMSVCSKGFIWEFTLQAAYQIFGHSFNTYQKTLG